MTGGPAPRRSPASRRLLLAVLVIVVVVLLFTVVFPWVDRVLLNDPVLGHLARP